MILNVYKPSGITSHDVVDAVRKITGERRVGHGGTLDPFADGVLVVGVGRESTRQLEKVLKGTEKEYVALLELGKISTTGDPEGELKNITPTTRTDANNTNKDRESRKVEKLKSEDEEELLNCLNVKKEKIEDALAGFRGEIEQRPPIYSAIKIRGKPAYKLAREGAAVELPKRRVTIYELEMLDYNPPFLKLRIVCSSGTYIRSLGADIGEALGTGAYVKALTRTRVGEYKIEESRSVEK